MAEDRITKMLTANPPGITNDLGEFATTLGSALVGRKGFGEALNEIRAGYLGQQAAAQQMEMAPKKQALAESKHIWDQIKFAAGRKDKYAKSMMDAIKLVTPNEDDARLVSERMHSYPDDITTENATALATRATNELVTEGAIGGQKRETRRENLAGQKRDLLLSQGYDEDTANGIAFGFISPATDPISGEMYLLDKRDGSRRAIRDVGGEKIPSALPKRVKAEIIEQNTMIDRLLLQLPEATTAVGAHSVGVGGYLGELSTETLGQIPGEIGEAFTFEQTVNDRQRIRLLREDLIKALAKHSRVPLAEQQRIIELLPKDGAWENPKTALSNLNIVGEFLTNIRKENAMSLGEVGFEGTRENPHKPTSQEDYDSVPSGAYFLNPATGTVRRKP